MKKNKIVCAKTQKSLFLKIRGRGKCPPAPPQMTSLLPSDAIKLLCYPSQFFGEVPPYIGCHKSNNRV